MEILFLVDGYYLVDEVTDDVIDGPFDTVEEAERKEYELMAPANWE